ncbi:MAG TPA: hypothetical protein DD473_06725 [Planctomycetaceae bacterium]|nr:hypothetical protein [Planctomycetaceae bacterium]
MASLDIETRFGSPDSKTIWYQNRNKSLLKMGVKDAWEGSQADATLKTLPSYLWMPAWVSQVAGHPTRARILCWLLDRFDNIDANNKQCRAYNTDESGDRWWRTSFNKIANAIILNGKVDSSLQTLVKQGLIETNTDGRPGTLIRPLGKPLIYAYQKISHDDSALSELKLADDDLQWHESITKCKIWGNVEQGVRVYDAIMVICDRHPGQAALLSNILYWHSQGRSRISRRGFLWCCKSLNVLAEETGYNRKSLAEWAKQLHQRGFIECRYWVWNRRRDKGQKTLHLRPIPNTIHKALVDHEWDIQSALSHKTL